MLKTSYNKKEVYNLPVQLANYIWDHDFIREAEVYFLIKYISNSTFNKSDGTIEFIAKSLKLSTRTILNRIKHLVSNKWIRENKKTFYITKTSTIMANLNLYSNRSAKATYSSFKDFEAFLASIMIANKLGAMKYKKIKSLKGAALKSTSPEANQAPFGSLYYVPDYLKLGTRGLKSLLNRSNDYVTKIKVRATKSNYLSVVKHIEVIKADYHINLSDVNGVKRGDPENAPLYKVGPFMKRFFKFSSHKSTIGKCIYKDSCDEIKPKINFGKHPSIANNTRMKKNDL